MAEEIDNKKMTSEDKDSVVQTLKGKISEVKVIKDLKEQGYEVRKIVKPIIKWGGSGIFQWFNDKGFDDLTKDYKGNKEELRRKLKENLNGLPDFMVLKDGILSFIEVKSNKSNLTEKQIETISFLKKEGFNCEVKRLKVEFKAEYTNE